MVICAFIIYSYVNYYRYLDVVYIYIYIYINICYCIYKYTTIYVYFNYSLCNLYTILSNIFNKFSHDSSEILIIFYVILFII